MASLYSSVLPPSASNPEPVCRMFVSTVVFTTVLFLVSLARPVERTHNIRDQIIEIDDPNSLVTENVLDTVQRQTISATKDTSGGIARSRVGFMRISRSGSGFRIPKTPGITFTAKLQGSVIFSGYLSNRIDSAVDTIAQSSSDDIYTFIRNERKNLQSRAGGRYFWFFQAAANYGYTKDEQTQRILADTEFHRLSNNTRSTLRNNESQRLTATYDTVYTGVSDGVSEVVNAFAFILINQITLDSGELLNIVQQFPGLTVADEDGNVIDTVEPGDVEIKPNLNDSVLDVHIE